MALQGRTGWRIAIWAGAAALLAAPVAIMQAGDEMAWSLADFGLFSVVVGAIGLTLDLLLVRPGDRTYRFAAAIALVAAVMLVMVNLTVGFLGSEDNPANRVFAGVLATAAVGAAAARFRSRGLALTMLAAAGVQVGIGVAALALGWSSPGGHGVYEVSLGTSLFTALWLTSAWLFHRSASRAPAAG